jgi:hypothetical protein
MELHLKASRNAMIVFAILLIVFSVGFYLQGQLDGSHQTRGVLTAQSLSTSDVLARGGSKPCGTCGDTCLFGYGNYCGQGGSCVSCGGLFGGGA